MDQCDIPPPGWRCTRKPGHNGPCAAVPVNGAPVHRRRWLLGGALFSLFVWALIVWAVVSCVGKPEVKRDARTECERTTPPWSIAERCR